MFDKNVEKKIFFDESTHDPHQFLGLHKDIISVIRLWRPGATEVFLEIQGQIVSANRVSEQGLFEIEVPDTLQAMDYRIYHASGLLAHDPYVFSPTLGEIDLFLFNKGVHYELYQVLGSSLCVHQGVQGTRFAVWAPGAKTVALVGDFNHWNGRANPMRSLGSPSPKPSSNIICSV